MSNPTSAQFQYGGALCACEPDPGQSKYFIYLLLHILAVLLSPLNMVSNP